MSCLLNTKRVQKKYKLAIRLHDSSIGCQSLYPGLISCMLPLDHDHDIILSLLDLALADDSGFGYCGALHLIYHLSEADIDLKLDVAKKFLTVTFGKLNSSFHIAKQVGWQESISRLLVRKHIASTYTVEGNYVLGKDIQNQPFEESGVEFAMDMLTFDEKTMELGSQSSMNRDHNVILNEIQASVTEAAIVIEHEIKGENAGWQCERKQSTERTNVYFFFRRCRFGRNRYGQSGGQHIVGVFNAAPNDVRYSHIRLIDVGHEQCER